MRPLLHTLVIGTAMLAWACNPAFDAAEKKNKNEIASSRDEVSARLAQASENSGDLAASERMYLQITKNSGNSKESVLQLANFYSRHNQAPRAVALLEGLQSKTPNDLDIVRAYANSLIRNGDSEKALSVIEQAISANSTNAYLYNSKGVALDKLGKYEEAKASYKKAIELSPDEEIDFKTNLSMSYILSGNYTGAISLLQPLLSDKNATPEIRQNLALAYGLSGDMEKAMRIGSMDLSIKEMNDNIAFYQMMAQKKGHRQTAGISGRKMDNSPADVFPSLLPAEPAGEVSAVGNPSAARVAAQPDLSLNKPAAAKPIETAKLPDEPAKNTTGTIAVEDKPAAMEPEKDKKTPEASQPLASEITKETPKPVAAEAPVAGEPPTTASESTGEIAPSEEKPEDLPPAKLTAPATKPVSTVPAEASLSPSAGSAEDIAASQSLREQTRKARHLKKTRKITPPDEEASAEGNEGTAQKAVDNSLITPDESAPSHAANQAIPQPVLKPDSW